MLLILGLLFVFVPIVELYVIIQVAHVIGGLPTIALLIIESAIGAWLMKRQGMGAMRRISSALDQQRVPGKELVDAFLIMLAGALMLTPGFVTDIFGFALLFPPTRRAVRKLLTARFRSGTYGRLFTMGTAGGARSVGAFRTSRGPVYDADGHEPATRPPQEPDRPELRG